jgi:hypothetical protein
MSNLSAPPPVPASGNGKYAIVAALLLAGIIGLFAFRSCGGSAAAPPPAPSAVAAVPSASASVSARVDPKIDDIPPPPEEKPEAGAATGGGGTRIVYVHVGGCDAKCTGKAPAELGAALVARAAQARRCYNSALAQDSSLKGHVTITVRVGPTGNVCSANVTANDMGTPAVANCAANIFRQSGTLPSPSGGCVEAPVPLSFVPQGQ